MEITKGCVAAAAWARQSADDLWEDARILCDSMMAALSSYSKPKERPAPIVSPDRSCGLRVRICDVGSLAVADALLGGNAGW